MSYATMLGATQYVQSVDMRQTTLIRVVKTLDGIERHYRNEKSGQIEVIFVARPSVKGGK